MAIAKFVVLLVLGYARREDPRSRWLVGTWAMFALLVFLAYAPNFGLQVLTGLWYSDPRRIMGAMQVVLVPIFTLAVVQTRRGLWVSGLYTRRYRSCWLSYCRVWRRGCSRYGGARCLRPGQPNLQAWPARPNSICLGPRQRFCPRTPSSLRPSVGTIYFQLLGNRKVVFPSFRSLTVIRRLIV